MVVVDLSIAQCDNCGAALRISDTASNATCSYCGVTSVVPQADQRASDAPALRILPPPPLEYTGARSAIPPTGCFVIGALLLVAGVVGIALGASIGEGIILPLLGLVAIAMGLVTVRDRRQHAAAVAELERFRREALVGRATVKTITAGTGRAATLGLTIEIADHPDRHVEHATVIPELLVPRLVEGLKLPVLVEGDRIEVRWPNS